MLDVWHIVLLCAPLAWNMRWDKVKGGEGRCVVFVHKRMVAPVLEVPKRSLLRSGDKSYMWFLV